MEKKLDKKKLVLIAAIVAIIILAIVVGFLLMKGGSNNVVTFDTGDGTSISSQIVNKNGKISKPRDPEREGYEFDGWYLDDEEFDFDEPITGDLKLEARWKKVDEDKKDDDKDDDKEEAKEYTVNFDSDGGTKVEAVKTKDKVSKPKVPTKDGYTFVAWQLNGKDYDFNLVVEKDITLKAKWEKKINIPEISIIKHRITFDSAGGSTVASVMVEKGKSAIEPVDPTKAGYKFLGWYLNDKLYDFNKEVYDNFTLVAKWQMIVVKETYSIEWIKIDESSLGEYMLHIKNSKGVHVSGVVTVTTINNKVDDHSITASGKKFIKSAVKSAVVKSVN